jgi:hypothetical protein
MMEMLDMTYDPTVLEAPWEETRWVCMSSFFFMGPAVYSYYNGLCMLGSVLTLTSLISANYWKNAIHSWERILDRIYAKVAFGILFTNGVRYVETWPFLLVGWSGVPLIGYCYYMSNKLGSNKLGGNKISTWWKYHMVFHSIIAVEQIIVIQSILLKSNINKGLL